MLQVIPDLSQSHIHAHSINPLMTKEVVTIKLFLDCAKSAVSTFEQVNILWHNIISLASEQHLYDRALFCSEPRLLYNTTKIADLAQPRKCSDFSLWEGP